MLIRQPANKGMAGYCGGGGGGGHSQHHSQRRRMSTNDIAWPRPSSLLVQGPAAAAATVATGLGGLGAVLAALPEGRVVETSREDSVASSFDADVVHGEPMKVYKLSGKLWKSFDSF
jgi:hypothetical protein